MGARVAGVRGGAGRLGEQDRLAVGPDGCGAGWPPTQVAGEPGCMALQYTTLGIVCNTEYGDFCGYVGAGRDGNAPGRAPAPQRAAGAYLDHTKRRPIRGAIYHSVADVTQSGEMQPHNRGSCTVHILICCSSTGGRLGVLIKCLVMTLPRTVVCRSTGHRCPKRVALRRASPSRGTRTPVLRVHLCQKGCIFRIMIPPPPSPCLPSLSNAPRTPPFAPPVLPAYHPFPKRSTALRRMGSTWSPRP